MLVKIINSSGQKHKNNSKQKQLPVEIKILKYI